MEGASRYPSPLRYPGGKARLAPYLADLYSHQFGSMELEIWIEPFAGGAGAGLALLEAEHVEEVWLYDTNPAIAAFWRTILTRGDTFASRIESTVPTMWLWNEAKQTLSAVAAGQQVDDTALAYAAFIINRCSRSGIITPAAGPIGGKSQTGRWNIGSRFNSLALAARLRHVAALPGLRFTEADAIDRITDLDDCGFHEEVLILVDPPYISEGNRLYTDGMTEMDHRRLASALNASPARWILTYDAHPDVLDLYRDRRILEFQIPHSANQHRAGHEYVVFSDNTQVHSERPIMNKGAQRWVA